MYDRITGKFYNAKLMKNVPGMHSTICSLETERRQLQAERNPGLEPSGAKMVKI